LVIRNVQIVNVFTGEILPGEIAVIDGYIAGVMYDAQTINNNAENNGSDFAQTRPAFAKTLTGQDKAAEDTLLAAIEWDEADSCDFSPMPAQTSALVNPEEAAAHIADSPVQAASAVAGGYYMGMVEVDGQGSYALPGLIDAHMHLESTMVRPSQFATSALPRGTTGVVADPHEVANVCGVAGIDFILADSSDIPLDVYLMVPSCVPATDFETSGARLDANQINEIMSNPRVRGLGEVMAYPAVIAADYALLEKLGTVDSQRGQVADGHSPWVEGKDLCAYVAAGIASDHECSSPSELISRARLGMYVQIREGSACRNLEALLPAVNSANSRRMLFCTDDKHPEDIYATGHIDNCIRMAIDGGLNPITAIQMATINVAECYGLNSAGALAPGYQADILLVDDLQNFSPRAVYKLGKLVAKNGEALFNAKNFIDVNVCNTVRTGELEQTCLELPLKKNKARVIGLRAHSVETDNLIEDVNVIDGKFTYDPNLDILKLAVIERHKASGNIGLGLVKGFGLSKGAIASTIGHDSHNIIVIGCNDEDMLLAAQQLVRVQGGITIACAGEVLDTLPLPIAGLMSDDSVAEVREVVERMREQAYKLGVNREIEPFMTLSFLALPVIPALKLTDRGLFDVSAFSHVKIEP
jgi:adenine deaminase